MGCESSMGCKLEHYFSGEGVTAFSSTLLPLEVRSTVLGAGAVDGTLGLSTGLLGNTNGPF